MSGGFELHIVVEIVYKMKINGCVLLLTVICAASISTCESRRQSKTSTRQKDKNTDDQSEEKVKKVLTKLIMEQLPAADNNKPKTKSKISIDSIQNDDPENDDSYQEKNPPRSNRQNLNRKWPKKVARNGVKKSFRNEDADNAEARGRISKTIPILDPHEAQAAILIPEKSDEKIRKKTSDPEASERLPNSILKQPNKKNKNPTNSFSTKSLQEKPGGKGASPRFNLDLPTVNIETPNKMFKPMMRSGAHIDNIVSRLTKKIKKSKDNLPIPELPNENLNLGNSPQELLGNNNLEDMGKDLIGNLGNDLHENLGNHLDENLGNYQNGNLGNNQGDNFEDNQNGQVGNKPSQNRKLNINHGAGKLNVDHDAGKLNINLDRNQNSNQNGNLGNNHNGNLGNGQQGNLGNGQHGNLGNGQHGNLGNGQQGNFGNGQQGNFGNGQQGNLGNGQHGNLGNGQHGNLGNNKHRNLGNNQQGNSENNQIKNLGNNQIEKLENNQNPNLENHQNANHENDKNKMMENNQNGNFGTSQTANLKNDLNAGISGSNLHPEYRKNLKKLLIAANSKNTTTSKVTQSSPKNSSQTLEELKQVAHDSVEGDKPNSSKVNSTCTGKHSDYPKIYVQDLTQIPESPGKTKLNEVPFERLMSMLKYVVNHTGPCYKIILPTKRRQQRIKRDAPDHKNSPKELREWEGKLFHTMLDREVDDFSIET